MNVDKVSWDDLRFALALARHPTMAAAATALHVHQSTVSRRVHALEDQLGVKLFEMAEAGIVMTEAGRAIARRAEKIEALASELENDIEIEREDDRQSVRISAVSTFITSFLNHHAGAFLDEYPHIRLDFIGEERNVVLERREADIAIRHAQPTTGQARTRKLGEHGTAVYAALELTDGKGNLMEGAPWVGFSRPLDYLPEQQWIDAHVAAKDIVITFASAATYANAVSEGIGAGLMSCMVGDKHPDLIRVHPREPVMYRESWLMVLDDTRRRPAVRSVINWLTAICRAHKDDFLGNVT